MSNIDGTPTRAEVAEWQSLKLYASFRAHKAFDVLSDTSRLARLQAQLDYVAHASNHSEATQSLHNLTAMLAVFNEALASLDETVMMHGAYWDRMAGEHRYRTAGDVFRAIAEKEVDRGRNS